MSQPPPKSVLLVGNFLSRHVGVRGVCEELAERLTAARWQVLTTSDQESKALRLADMVRTIWREREHYRVAQVDVYSYTAFLWAEAACWALRQAGKPYALTLHGGGLPEYAERNPRRVGRLLTSARAVTAPSKFLRDQMAPYRSDIELIPNALDLSRYPFHRRLAAEPRVVWLRAFHAIYNPGLAIRAVARLVDRFPAIQLLMVGPDKGDGSLERAKEEAARLGLTGRVEFQGTVPKAEIAHWINRGDIFLNSTTVDNTPVTVLEALACGACVISTDVGGIPYLLRHEEDALLVPNNDAGAMADAIGRVLTNPNLAAALSGRGRRKVESMDWPVVIRQWTSLLEKIKETDADDIRPASGPSDTVNDEASRRTSNPAATIH